MIIRGAQQQDLAELVSLLSELFSIEEDFVIDEQKQSDGLQMLLDQSDTSAIIVAEDGGKVIAMCTAQLLISTAQGSSTGLIEDMVVTGSYRRKGIGKLVLSRTVEWCRENGATRVQLLADKTNQPALDFYCKEGWDSTRMICLRTMV